MYNVEFFTFSKKQNSTARPAGSGTVFPCRANTSFDILAPSVALNTGTYPGNYNYCYIPEFGRYYYCTFRFDAETGLWWADCQVDAMASWKPQIGALSGYVLRSAAEWDGTVVDTMYPTKTPTLSYVNITDPWESTYLYHCYVVGIVGYNSHTSYYLMTGSELATFIQTIFGDPFYNTATGGSVFKADFNPMQYVTCIKKFPVKRPAITVTQNIYLGYWDTGLPGERITNRTYQSYDGTINIPKHPQSANRGEYLNNTPFIDYLLTAPPFGMLSLPAHQLVNVNQLTYTVNIDFVSGNGIMTLSTAPFEVIGTYQATVGCAVQLSQVMTRASAVVTDLLGVAGSLFTGNFLGAAGGIGNAISDTMPTVQTTGIDAGMAGIFYAPWSLTVTTYDLVEEDLVDKGRPLCKVKRLDTLPGYQLVGDIHLEIPCTEQEKETITATVTGGYYFE